MAMVMIFFNAGIAIVYSIGAFGPQFEQHASVWNLLAAIATFEFEIPFTNWIFPGMMVLAMAFAAATAIVLGTKPISDRGVAIITFTGLFWGSFLLAFSVLYQLPGDATGLFLGVFSVAAVLIFTMGLIQMPTGGQKSHV